MRTVELWIDLYAHSVDGDVLTWPVWGQWRCVQAGRVHWHVSGFLLGRHPATAHDEVLTVQRVRTMLEGDPAAAESIFFPREVLTGAHQSLTWVTPPAGAPAARRFLVDSKVAATVDTLAIEERLAIGLNIDPVLAGSLDIYPAQLLHVPSAGPRLRIADRADVCVVQLQPSDHGRAPSTIPGWERVRILEITPPGAGVGVAWSPDLQTIPMTEVRGCSSDAEDTIKNLLLSFRPHVIVSHVPDALLTARLQSTYVVATTFPGAPRPPYEALTQLLGQGASSVLVLREMASAPYAQQLIRVLCERGTLTDALLELHQTPGADRDVTVCGRDLRLRLRAAEGQPAPQHQAVGRASAWVPLGDRLRAAIRGKSVRVVALSGHVISATASLRHVDGEPNITTRGVPGHLVARVRQVCTALAQQHPVGGYVEVSGAIVTGLDPDDAILQACAAAVQRALDGTSADPTGYLLVPQDLVEDARGGDLLPTMSPVLVDGVATGSLPWTPEPDRVWRSWCFGEEFPDTKILPTVLPSSCLVEDGTCNFAALTQRLGRTGEDTRALFPKDRGRAAAELADPGPVLVTADRVLWATLRRHALSHTTLVNEA